MMKTFKVILSLFGIISLMSSALLCAESPVFIRGIRPLGMGGAFVALSDDQNAIFYNPAGITQRQAGELTLFELPVNISEDVMNFYQFYSDNQDALSNFDSQSNSQQLDLLNNINDKITLYRPRMKVGFPNTSYLTGSRFLSWGFGAFDQADIGFQFNRSLIIPSISVWGNVDLLAAVPLAHRFDVLPYVPGKLSTGVTLKYIRRARVAEYNKSILEFESFNPQLQWGQGFGADLGLLYQPTSRWNVGLQATDIGGTVIKFEKVEASEAGQLTKDAFDGMIPGQVNAGAAYIPSKIVYWPGKAISTQDRLVLALDVRDVTSSDEPLFEATFWKKLHMGAELRWGPLSLRGGFNSGYPSIGAGFRIPYLGLKLQYAYWGDELGRYAGQMPVWNHQLNIALSWGDSKGRSYGSAVKKNELTVQKTLAKEQKAPEMKTPSATGQQNSSANESASTPGTGPSENAAQTAAPAVAE